MMAGLDIFYILLAFYWQASTAELDPTHRVNAMNAILTSPGWRALNDPNGIAIVFEPMDGAQNRVLQVQDILKTDRYGQIVNYDNAEDKVRQVHQLLSCRYGNGLKVFYEYSLGAARQCVKINDTLRSLNCVDNLLEMIKEMVDELLSRLQGMFSCIRQLSPATAFDTDVSNAVDDFKSYRDHLTFAGGSLDREYHKSIIASTSDMMADALQSLRRFYDKFCRPAARDDQDNRIYTVSGKIRILERSRGPIELMHKIKKRVRKIVEWYVKNYDEVSIGFEYDPVQQKTRIVNDQQ